MSELPAPPQHVSDSVFVPNISPPHFLEYRAFSTLLLNFVQFMEKKSMMLTVLYPLVRAQLTITFF